MIEKGGGSAGNILWLLPHFNIFTLHHTFLNPVT